MRGGVCLYIAGDGGGVCLYIAGGGGGRAVQYLGLPGDGRHVADLLGPQGVDDGALPHVGVADEPNADLLLISVELGGEEEMLYVSLLKWLHY